MKTLLIISQLLAITCSAQVAVTIAPGIPIFGPPGSVFAAELPPGVSEPTADILWLKWNDGSGTVSTADVGPNAYATGGGWTTGADTVAKHAFNGGGDTTSYTGTTDSPANVTYEVNVITVCFWAYNSAWGTGNTTLFNSSTDSSKANTWWIYNDEGTVTFIMQGTTVGSYQQSTVAAPSNNAWHHFAVVFDASTATGTTTVYLDGVAQSPTTVTNTKDGTSNFAAQPLYMLSRNGTATTFWGGYMDDVRIYAYALSAGQVAAVYANPE